MKDESLISMALSAKTEGDFIALRDEASYLAFCVLEGRGDCVERFRVAGHASIGARYPQGVKVRFSRRRGLHAQITD